MDRETKKKVKKHLAKVMERIIERKISEPLTDEQILLANPFGFRLVPMEVWRSAKFERSFVTTLGQGIFEQLAKIIAEGSGAIASNQHDEKMKICTFRLEQIDSILKVQRESKRQPNWEEEINEIVRLNNERFEEVTVKSDLYIQRSNGTKEFYSFKTVKPNLDQTERAKRDMMRLVAGNPTNQAYFALPFNPAGEGLTYKSSGFSIPLKLLDFSDQNCVLIGAALWNKIGQSNKTYTELLDIFEDVGEKFMPIIRRDYLKLNDYE